MGESLSASKKALACGDGERGGLADVLAVDADGAGFGAEALAAAIGALGVAAILAEHDAHVQLVLLALHLRRRSRRRRRSCPCRAERFRALLRAGRARGRREGCPASAACLRSSVNQGRYLGRFQGSMAPSARVRLLSGMTRLRSKSMVLPKPWQRGQAPKGLLKLNRRGSGSRPGRWQLLHS